MITDEMICCTIVHNTDVYELCGVLFIKFNDLWYKRSISDHGLYTFFDLPDSIESRLMFKWPSVDCSILITQDIWS